MEDKVEHGARFWFEVLALFLTYMGRGLILDADGPTLLDLLQITHTEINKSAFVFVSQATGILAGSFLATTLLDRMCPELLMAAVCLLQGVATAAIPWLNLVPLMCIPLCLQGLGLGMAGVGVCAIALGIGKAESQRLLQTVYLGLALGAIIGPLLVQPFLSKTHLAWEPSTSNDSINLHPIIFSEEMNTLQLNKTSMGHAYYYSTPTKVMYYFLISGSFFLLPSLIFLCLYLSDKKQHDYESFASDDESDTDHRKPPSTRPANCLCSKVAAFGMLLLFSTLFYAIQEGIGDLLTPFAVKCHLHLQKKEGNYLTMCYWASVAVGRLIGIPLVNCFKAATIVVYNLMGSIIASIIILTFYYSPYFHYVLWGMICMLGLGLSTVNGSIISWAAEKLKNDRYTVNIVNLGYCFGFLTGPSIIAALFKTIGPISLMVGAGIVSVFLLLLFITMMCTVPKQPDTEVNKSDSH